MQRLGLNSEQSELAVEPLPVPGFSSLARLIALLLISLPILLLAGLAIYYLATLGVSAGLQATLAMVVTLLLLYQILSGISRLSQIVGSLQTTRRNTISRRLGGRFTLHDSPKVQPVSIIIWTHNQSWGLVETIKSLLALNYPDYEIIIIDDGSTDDTLAVLKDEFDLQPLNRVVRRLIPTGPIHQIYSSPKYPILSVVEKPRNGRAQSLNIGLNLAQAPLVCILDSDYLVSRDALLLLAKPFIEQPTNTLMSAGLGEAQADPDETGTFMDNLQAIERKRLFHSCLLERNAFCLVSANNNAIRLLRKTELVQVGGFPEDNTDLQINLRLQQALLSRKQAYRVSFIPDTLCWRRSDTGQASISSGYQRWQASTLQTLASNINLVWQPRLGWRYSALLLLIGEIVSPLLELGGLLLVPLAGLTGVVGLDLVIAYFITVITFALLESLASIIADELSLRCRHSLTEIINLILASLVESLFFRPLTNSWRLSGAFTSLISS